MIFFNKYTINTIKLVIIIFIIFFVSFVIIFSFKGNIGILFQKNNNILAESGETKIDYETVSTDGINYELSFNIQNSNGIEKVILPDIELKCNNKKQVGIDRILTDGEIYQIKVKTKDVPQEELYTLVVSNKPKMSIANFDVDGDGLKRRIEIDYGYNPNTKNYYSLDNGISWQEYIGPIDIVNNNKENLLAKIVYDEGKTINKAVKYADCIDAIKFGDVSWINGKANVVLDSIHKEYIEYQINGTSGAWIRGYSVTGINHNDVIYSRINDGTHILDQKDKQVADNIPPSKVDIKIEKLKYNSITISVDGVDNETGIAYYTYVLEEGTDNKTELTNITEITKKIENLLEKTIYKVYVVAYDNVGNSTKSSELEVTTPEYVPPTPSTIIKGTKIGTPREGRDLDLGTNYIVGTETVKYDLKWSDIAEIAKAISNTLTDIDETNNITSDVSEFNITYDGDTYLLGVGDRMRIDGQTVRILGFNHDDLVNIDEEGNYKNAYGEGYTNLKAGISFEYERKVMNVKMSNSSYTNNGWGAAYSRDILNGSFFEDIKSKIGNNIIKQVSKPYYYSDSSSSILLSNDYMWILSRKEIWDTGNDGKQYQYYYILNPEESVRNGYLAQSTYSANVGTVWLRTIATYKYYHSISSEGRRGTAGNADYPYSVVPGFCV